MSVKQLLRKHSSEQSEHYFFAFLLSHKCLMNHEPETSHQQFSLPKNTRDLNMSKLFWCFYLVQESCLFESELDTRVPFKCFISLSTGCPKKPILLLFTIDPCQICSKDILVDTLQFSKQKTVFPHLLK